MDERHTRIRLSSDASSKIRHTEPTGFGVDASTPAASPESKIRQFEQKQAGHHEEKWKRPTNMTGTGATHVRSFHCKLADGSLDYLDEQINEWLDLHPDYEVKFVTTEVGLWTGKIKEPHLIVLLWV